MPLVCSQDPRASEVNRGPAGEVREGGGALVGLLAFADGVRTPAGEVREGGGALPGKRCWLVGVRHRRVEGSALTRTVGEAWETWFSQAI
jgi:hypothetical protein